MPFLPSLSEGYGKRFCGTLDIFGADTMLNLKVEACGATVQLGHPLTPPFIHHHRRPLLHRR